MLSFTLLTHENAERFISNAEESLLGCDCDFLADIVSTLLEEECEVATTLSDGCLLARIFDDEYSFVFPLELTDDADAEAALEEIRRYVMKEEIPLVFSDVPRDVLGWLIPKFRHVTLDATDSDGECYRVRVFSEAAMLDDIPTLDFGGLVLDKITKDDDPLYARLSKDEKTNEFWGYDYRSDVAEPSDDYFRHESESEFNRGAAMSFAVRRGGEFIGEVTLYAFDLSGGCEIGIRILPEYRRFGAAGRILEGFFATGSCLGLTNLCARVMKDNAPSVALCTKYFKEKELIDDNTYKFTQII